MSISMRRIFHKSKNHEEADLWDIQQQISMTPTQRQKAAKAIRLRVYGRRPDVRASQKSS
jgi:hypothetical protein